MARGDRPVRDTSNRGPAVTGDYAPQAPATGIAMPRQQAEPSSPVQILGALPSGPRTLQTGLAGANHVKAPPPPLLTFGHPIEFKQLAPKNPTARNRDLLQGVSPGLSPASSVMFSS